MVRKLPAWLAGLMAERFFAVCGAHHSRRKNEKNVFCLLCCISICPHCLPSHRSHPLLQVRRYVYHDVIRLDDLEKLIDCSYIQPYTINGAKVIFLNQRPQSRSCKGSANICFTCDRILQEPFHFCSLSCKVDHLSDQGVDLSSIIYRIHEADFSLSQFEGLRVDAPELMEEEEDHHHHHITPNSVLMEEYSSHSQRGSSSESEVVGRRNRSSGSFLGGIVLSLSNRRKGAPQRAPMS